MGQITREMGAMQKIIPRNLNSCPLVSVPENDITHAQNACAMEPGKMKFPELVQGLEV